MRKRILTLVLAGMLVAGGAGCGDDDDSGGSDGGGGDTATTVDSGDGDGSEGSLNADIEAYCDAVDELVDAYQDAGNDPAALAQLTDELTNVSNQGADLTARAGEFDADDSERLSECLDKATEGLSGAAN